MVDNQSTDKTVEIAKVFTPHVFPNSEKSLGLLKQFALSKATKDWILLVDIDEFVSRQLQKEIKDVLSYEPKYDAYAVPYKNHFLGHALKSKAQTYSKVRLFRRNKGSVTLDPVHEEVVIKGRIGNLKGEINHYSFRSLPQILSKFTRYAQLEAKLYFAKGEKATFKKFTLYPLHMFWSIFVEDEGYRDGIYGFLLALCFSYYEFARYFFLLFTPRKSARP
ncbi:MAG: Glycosyltransferase [Candidatus Gottesmanbacteria bacterium GW2011_GWA1_43_11]|uniref:Glycosyltransferase n=1 Tax=Candidatus Gottesmanbacteria bacterium GW2011_GWA1_43_11 TaxID=1618436 RepID=A0A0G1CGY8_9BACT|nr:MAG: Glycosyltransferase [Candidatus Gottesmanbacteria bacterium GW2011_GWA1_43_11]